MENINFFFLMITQPSANINRSTKSFLNRRINELQFASSNNPGFLLDKDQQIENFYITKNWGHQYNSQKETSWLLVFFTHFPFKNKGEKHTHLQLLPPTKLMINSNQTSSSMTVKDQGRRQYGILQ